MTNELTPSDAAYWEQVYQSGEDRWELGFATPPLARWFADKDLTGKRALVIGCGRGHEARLLASRGARVVGLDLANDAVVAARALTPPDLAVEFRQGDLFALRGQPAAYDLVVEHTCYCAIEIARREEYVDAIADAIVSGGDYVALFYAHGRPGGPPFTTDVADLQRFDHRFEQLHSEVPPDSIERRANQEILRHYRRR